MRRINAIYFSLVVLLSVCLFAMEVPVMEAASENTEKAGQAGEEFQSQAPWFRERTQSGGYYYMPQPEHYLAVPESQTSEKEPNGSQSQYPLCYNPYTREYEYCYPWDYNYFRVRFRSPEFRFWWVSERNCPSGYYFSAGYGCYRY